MKKQETPQDRAFRHEREKYMLSLLPFAIAGVVVMIFLLSWAPIPTEEKVARFFLGILMEVVIFSVINFVMKWHQNKYGGD